MFKLSSWPFVDCFFDALVARSFFHPSALVHILINLKTCTLYFMQCKVFKFWFVYCSLWTVRRFTPSSHSRTAEYYSWMDIVGILATYKETKCLLNIYKKTYWHLATWSGSSYQDMEDMIVHIILYTLAMLYVHIVPLIIPFLFLFLLVCQSDIISPLLGFLAITQPTFPCFHI